MRGKSKKFILILFVIFTIIAQGSLWVSAAPKSNLKVQVGAGFNGSYKYGYDVPINMTIENKNKDINGEVQIYAINGEGRSIIYSKSLSLPKSSTKNITLNVPIMNASTKFKIVILDNKDKVYEEDCSMPSGASEQTILIGILSDEFDNVSYINRVSVRGNSTLPSKTIKIDEKSFPEDISVIRGFDVIVINNFDTSKLNKKKYETLKKWVNDGGILIIGTGDTYSKTLSLFKDEFIGGKTGSISRVTTNELNKLVNEGKNISNVGSISSMTLNSLNIDIDNSEKLYKEGDMYLIQKLTKGKGGVIVTSFDLGLNPVSTWDQNSVLGEKLIGLSKADLTAILNKGNNGDMYSISEAVSCNSELPVPKTNSLAVIIAIYVILAGPVSYIVLKKFDKRGYMWATVPALSIVFAVIMYISGNGTRMTEPVANIVSIANIDEKGNITKTTYGGVFTPRKGDLKIQGAAGVKIIPYANDMFQYKGNNATESRQVDAKVVMDGSSYIQYYDASAFNNKVVSIDEEQSKTQKLEMSLVFNNNHFSGTIKNNTGYDLEDCNLINGNVYLTIDSIKNGETKKLNDICKAINLNQGGVWQIIDPTMKNGYGNYGPGVNMTASKRKEILDMRQKSAIARVFMNNGSRTLNTPMFIGWSKTVTSKKINVNDKAVKTYERTFITAPLQFKIMDGNKRDYPFGYLQPSIENTIGMIKADSFNSKIFGQGSMELVYKIDSSVKAERAEIIVNTYGSLDVKLAIWNNETRNWEEGNVKGFTKEGDTLSKYIDKDNNVRYRLERINDSAPTDIPQISVKGSVK